MSTARCPVTKKKQFPSFDAAAHAALVASRIRGHPLRVYVCEHCERHHLTKKPSNPRVATVPGPFTPADMARLAGRRTETA